MTTREENLEVNGKRVKYWRRVNIGVCLSSFFVALALSVTFFIMGDNPRHDTFSSTGIDNRLLFATWGGFTGVAVFFNFKELARKLNILSKWFYIVIWVSSVSVMLTSVVIGRHQAVHILHVATSMIFGISGILCVIYLLVMKYKRHSRYTTIAYAIAMFAAAVYFIIICVQMGWFTMFIQMLVINLALVIMVCSNFIEKWSKEQKQSIE